MAEELRPGGAEVGIPHEVEPPARWDEPIPPAQGYVGGIGGPQPQRLHDVTERHRHMVAVRTLAVYRPLRETTAVRQRVSVITLGVRDLTGARRFYEALGWRTGANPDDDVVFFQAGDMVLSLWSREELAHDSCVEDGGGWGGVTLALNVGSPEEVDAVTEEARAAGATIGREPDKTFWGGYSAVFIDPEGHPWEVAHNPHWELTDQGGVRLR